VKPLDWLKNLLIAVDQLANTLLRGDPDETISSRAYREKWRIVPLIDAVFWFDPEHCRTSFESEFVRRKFPEFLRN